jgi:hypothetical protein
MIAAVSSVVGDDSASGRFERSSNNGRITAAAAAERRDERRCHDRFSVHVYACHNLHGLDQSSKGAGTGMVAPVAGLNAAALANSSNNSNSSSSRAQE